jgi:hypothetical protein
MSLENLPVYVTIGYVIYEGLAISYNLKRLTEGKKLKRISVASLWASRGYPEDYFKSEKQASEK